MLQTFVDGTNSFARNEGLDFKPVDMEELKKFFAIILYIGVVKMPEIVMFWSKNSIFRNEVVHRIMSRNRFEAIASNLHWLDASGISAEERKRRNKADGFWTISSFLDDLAGNFRKYYECGQKISIDEMAIFFKVRHRCRCYNPSKPNKWHFKAYCLNDADTGYLSNFFMYRGKDERRPADMPATLYPVMELCKHPCYHNKQHLLATDNWYTQLELLIRLHNPPYNMNVCGTCKTNKKGIPRSAIFSKTGANKKNRGEPTFRRLLHLGKH